LTCDDDTCADPALFDLQTFLVKPCAGFLALAYALLGAARHLDILQALVIGTYLHVQPPGGQRLGLRGFAFRKRSQLVELIRFLIVRITRCAC
jgi:hypothetical protein